MSTRCSRITGGAWRRYKTMIALNCQEQKERKSARQRPNRKRKGGAKRGDTRQMVQAGADGLSLSEL